MVVEVWDSIGGELELVATVRSDEESGITIESDDDTRQGLVERVMDYGFEDGALWVADLPNSWTGTFDSASYADEESRAEAEALLEADAGESV